MADLGPDARLGDQVHALTVAAVITAWRRTQEMSCFYIEVYWKSVMEMLSFTEEIYLEIINHEDAELGETHDTFNDLIQKIMSVEFHQTLGGCVSIKDI